MRITESTIRRIINQEAKRVLREGEEERHSDSETMNHNDPVGLVERYMTDIEDLFKGGYDHDDAMDEANDMIEDLCFNMNNAMQEWLMDYLKDNEQDRAEYEEDAEYDREMHRGEDNDR